MADLAQPPAGRPSSPTHRWKRDVNERHPRMRTKPHPIGFVSPRYSGAGASGRKALFGLVLVSTDARRHNCTTKTWTRSAGASSTMKVSGKLTLEERAGLRPPCTSCAQETCTPSSKLIASPGKLLKDLLMLNALFHRGLAVKILEGIAAVEVSEWSFLLDLVPACLFIG